MSKTRLFSYGVLTLSILNIYYYHNQLLSLSVALSVIGILGFITLLMKSNSYKILFLIWVIGQIPIIDVSIIQNGTKLISPIFDLSQLIKFKLGFGLTYTPKTYNFGINIVAVGFYMIYKMIAKEFIISSNIRLVPIDKNSPIAPFTPIKAKITAINDEYLAAKLDKDIIIANVTYPAFMFKTADNSTFKLEKSRQKCIIKLISVDKKEFFIEAFINKAYE